MGQVTSLPAETTQATASMVTITDAGGNFDATTVEGALAEIMEGGSESLEAHLADNADAHDASAISVVPAGTIAATDVQAALEEIASDAAAAITTVSNNTTVVADDLAAHLADTADAHDASAVSIADVGTFFTGTDVEAALQELGAVVASGYTDEQARDAIGTALVAGEGIDITVDDGGDTITVAAEDATDSNKGIAELATGAETKTGTDADRAVTPAGLRSFLDDFTVQEWAVNTVAASGATETLDTSAFATHDVTMDEACTLSFANPAPSGHETEFKLLLRGAFTPTFPASVDWNGGTPPTYTTPAEYYFSTVDGGTTWWGKQTGRAFA